MVQLTLDEFIRFLKAHKKANTFRSHRRTFRGGGSYEEREYFTCPNCLKKYKSTNWRGMNHIRRCGISHKERTGIFKK